MASEKAALVTYLTVAGFLYILMKVSVVRHLRHVCVHPGQCVISFCCTLEDCGHYASNVASSHSTTASLPLLCAVRNRSDSVVHYYDDKRRTEPTQYMHCTSRCARAVPPVRSATGPRSYPRPELTFLTADGRAPIAAHAPLSHSPPRSNPMLSHFGGPCAALATWRGVACARPLATGAARGPRGAAGLADVAVAGLRQWTRTPRSCAPPSVSRLQPPLGAARLFSPSSPAAVSPWPQQPPQALAAVHDSDQAARTPPAMSPQADHPTLLIPGPIEFDDAVLQSMSHYR